MQVRLAQLFLGAMLCAISLQLGCHGRTEGADPRSSAAAPAAEPPPVAVTATSVAEEPMPEYLLVTGTLLANQESHVAAGVSGKVLVTYVERGTRVQKGQVLARLDTRTISANVAEAQAMAQTAKTQREQARIDCERSRSLHEKGAMSDAEYTRTQSQCLAAQSQADAAESRARSLAVTFGDAEIRAPFAGFVAERNVSAGEYVQPSTQVATIVETDPLRLELSVPESAAGAMRQGLAVEFRLASNEEKRFTGTIRYLGPSVRRQSRDLLVEAMVDNHEHALIPGMFATARVHVGDPNRAVVPAGVVRTEGSLHYVFVIKDGKLEQRIVQLGETRDGRVAILDGVKPGEEVAEHPADLFDGQRVKR